MAYKDKDKQREANRQAKVRQRAKQGMTKGMTNEGVTVSGSGTRVIPKRGKDIKCFADLHPGIQQTIERMSKLDPVYSEGKRKRTQAAIKYQHLFPDRYEPQDAVCTGVVTGKPGDADYNGVCTESWRVERGR